MTIPAAIVYAVVIAGAVAAVVVSALLLVLNAVTPSAGERRIWVPVATVLLATSLTIALSA